MAATVYSVTVADAQPAVVRGIKRFYAPELDALRFVAFLMVFVRHVANSANAGITAQVSNTAAIVGAASAPASPLIASVRGFAQSLDFGVCLFFFLSSFLITRLLLLEREKFGTVNVGDFYIRRTLRIWPLYFTFLLLTWCLSHLVPVLSISRGRLLASVFFVSNWAAVLHGWSSISIQPLWSVSVEEQFYLVWPNLARHGRRVILFTSSLLATVTVLTLLYFGLRHGTVFTEIWPNTLVQAAFFGAGALLACKAKPELWRISLLYRCLLLLGGLAMWVIAAVGLHIARTDSPGAVSLLLGYLLVVIGTFMVFASAAGWNYSPIPPWLVHLGKISYGLYVFHVFCLLISEACVDACSRGLHLHPRLILSQVAAAGLAFAMTLTLAMLSYKYLELPFLSLKKRFTVIPSRPD